MRCVSWEILWHVSFLMSFFFGPVGHQDGYFEFCYIYTDTHKLVSIFTYIFKRKAVLANVGSLWQIYVAPFALSCFV